MIRNFQSSTPPLPPYPPVPSGAPSTTPLYTSPYLPAGTPPWPNGVLQRPPQANVSQATVATGTLMERKPRSARGVMLALGLSVLAVLVGIGLTLGVLFLNGQLSANTPQAQRALPVIQATATSGANAATPGTGSSSTLPTPNSFSTISRANQKIVGVIVKYPGNWVEEPPQSQQPADGSGIAVFHPQQQLGIAVYIWKFPPASNVTTTSALNQAIINLIYSGGGNSGNTNLKSVQPANQHPTFAGTQWDEQDATFSDSNGIPGYLVSISVQHGTTFYTFSFVSPQMYLNDAAQKYIQPMMDSFKFLS